MKPDLFWIPGPWRGKLAIAARPRGGDWIYEEAKAWRQAGIDVVVSLLEEREAEQLGLGDERKSTEENGMRFISFPIPDRGVPSSMREAVSVIADVADVLEQGKNVAIHCRQGIGRSGMIVTSVLMTSGVSPEEAMQVVSSARGVRIPETSQQVQWTQQLPTGILLQGTDVFK